MDNKKEIEVTSIDFAKFICNNKNYNVYKLINKDELKSYVETVWLNHKVPFKEFITFIDWDRLIIDCGNIVSFDTKEENEVDNYYSFNTTSLKGFKIPADFFRFPCLCKDSCRQKKSFRQCGVIQYVRPFRL